ncbi:TetR/AcrR family transcriptional regulator [Symbioplanes lichenis]|uniref:TetR/AcrR family transcriptional regulator n=1 Tax=Symbioplanes lichenis TaxID=1629072 RepID=UPI002738F8A8|nr:TetR/AcrR family transcriptional regulator [Actinoplanes lichenis]
MEAQQRAPIGRPREFDIDEALEQAMLVFWRHGYDSVSLTDLTRAMGITKTSLYAAFGSKDELFRRALERYREGPAAYATRAVLEPTAREVARAYLTGSVHASTQFDGPTGCLGVQGYVAAPHLAEALRASLDEWAAADRARLSDRFRRAVAEGDLPAEADPDVLARYLMTTANGIGVQAAGGASRDELQQVADFAVQNWPAAGR